MGELARWWWRFRTLAGTQRAAPWTPARSCFVEGPHRPLPPRWSRSQMCDGHSGAPGQWMGGDHAPTRHHGRTQIIHMVEKKLDVDKSVSRMTDRQDQGTVDVMDSWAS